MCDTVALVRQYAAREPESLFKVVLCGDAAVGKSSFLLRLCKGEFHERLTSTLGEYCIATGVGHVKRCTTRMHFLINAE